MEQATAAMSDRLSGLRGKSVSAVSVGLSVLVAQVHLPRKTGLKANTIGERGS